MILPHLYGLFTFLAILMASIALALGLLVAVRSKEPYLKYFLAVLCAFDLKFFIDLIRSYAILNIPDSSPVFFTIAHIGSLSADFTYIFFLFLVWRSFSPTRYSGTIAAGFTVILIVSFVLLVVGTTGDRGVVIYGMSPRIAVIGKLSSILVFLLTVLMGFSYLGKTEDKGRRFFLLLTLLCSCFGLIQMTGGFVIRLLQQPGFEPGTPRPGMMDFPWLPVYFGSYTAGIIFFFLKYHLLRSSPVHPAGRGDAEPSPLHAALDAFCGTYDISVREREILELVVEGCSNGEIGGRLFISTGTVKTHMHNLFRKTGTGTRTRLIRSVLK